MPKLYELTEDLRTVEAWLEEAGDELLASGGEIPPHIAELLGAAEGAFDAKVEAYARMIRNQESFAEAAKEEAARLTAKRKTAESRAAWLRENLKACMLQAGRDKVKTPVASLSIRDNGTKYKCANLEALALVESRAVIVETVTSTKYALNTEWLAAVEAEAPEHLPAGVVAERSFSLTLR